MSKILRILIDKDKSRAPKYNDMMARSGRARNRVEVVKHRGISIYYDKSIDPKIFNTNRVVNIYVNKIPDKVQDGYSILSVFTEPEYFRVRNNEVIARSKEFRLILAHDPEILQRCPNATKVLYGTTWINEADRGIGEKQFEISFICGNKLYTAGHILRQQVWKARKAIKTPAVFWMSSRKPIPGGGGRMLPADPHDKIVALRTSQFHITIENCRVGNYFSEKLIDCFVTGTIPIYWGCPNIGEYFDIRGMIIARDCNDIIRACNELTPNEYNRRLEYIRDNYRRALEFCVDPPIKIKKIVEEINEY